MNFFMLRAISRDHYYASRDGTYESWGCLGFIGKVLFILAILVVCKKCGVVS